MKLYTEEDVRDMLNTNVEFDCWTPNIDSILSDYTPIELPSDEEIEKEAFKESSLESTNMQILARLYMIHGAKWMREQILKNK